MKNKINVDKEYNQDYSIANHKQATSFFAIKLLKHVLYSSSKEKNKHQHEKKKQQHKFNI